VLGEKDLQSIASGFQLGQVYLMNNKHDAALSTHRHILEQRVAVFGQASAEVIESSEVIGIVLVSNKTTFEHGFDLLRQALDSKKQMYGNDLSDITEGRGGECLRSLGESLIDLVMASSNDDEQIIDTRKERIDARLQDLHTKLVSEVISESNISAARDNTDAFEREADAT
jgi:hypothetical protein